MDVKILLLIVFVGLIKAQKELPDYEFRKLSWQDKFALIKDNINDALPRLAFNEKKKYQEEAVLYLNGQGSEPSYLNSYGVRLWSTLLPEHKKILADYVKNLRL